MRGSIFIVESGLLAKEVEKHHLKINWIQKMAVLGWPFYFGGVTMLLSRLLVFFILAGCASSKPTPYQKEKKKEGYQDKTVDGLQVSSFKGNSKTKKEHAQLYAQFRAIENCHEKENKIANIIDVFDKTIEKNYVRSTGGGWGPSYFGTFYPYSYPYYSRSSFGIGVGYNTVNTSSWNETLVYPIVEVYYTCSDKVLRPQLIFKEINADDMKHLVKDIKGALQIESLLENSPNKGVVEIGDIILKANGKRIEKVYELIRLFDENNREVSVQLLREGKRVVAKLRSLDVTEDVKKTETSIIQNVCDKFKKKKDRLIIRNICQ